MIYIIQGQSQKMHQEKLTSLAIISLGNQAKSWALNLSDSGINVQIGVRSKHTSTENFIQQNPKIAVEVIHPDWLKQQKAIALLIPDDQHPVFLKQHQDNLTPGTILIYAHGFSEVAYSLNHNYPQFIHCLLAPKSIASELRQNFLEKKILAAVYALPLKTSFTSETLQKTEEFLFLVAKNLGITWGPFRVTFEQECKADLFSEQTLLCNLLPDILAKGYSTMVSKNIPWQLAFCEIFLELKLIINALEQVGPEEFFKLISPNALMGSNFYREKWQKELPYEKLFEQCWEKLENGEMIKYLTQAKIEKIRDNVLNDWKHKPLTLAYQKFLTSK